MEVQHFTKYISAMFLKGEHIDQMGRKVLLEHPPQRIISLVPSQTELLVDLGLEDRLVGLTKFCIHPERIRRSKIRIGGTKQFDFDKIAALQPDLIIGNKEENEKGEIEKLAEKYPVWMSDIFDLKDALAMIAGIGQICNVPNEAKELVGKIEANFSALGQLREQKEIRVAYLIWQNPDMLAGTHTFINNMIVANGWQNVCADLGKIGERYPTVSQEELATLKPDLILLSSEPFPFKEKHIAAYNAIAPTTLVDGEMFSWYGSRLLLAPKYFENLQSDVNSISQKNTP